MRKCGFIKRGHCIKGAVTVAIAILFAAALASICDNDSFSQDQPWHHSVSTLHIYESLLLALQHRGIYATVPFTALNANALILYLELQEKSPPLSV